MAALAGAGLLLAGCQVDVVVGLEAGADGSGLVAVQVTVDEEVVAELPDLATSLEVDDLVAAGWELAEPVERPDGGVVVRAVKPFASPAGAGRALRELTGAEGPFADLTLERREELFATSYALHGTVDLTPGLAVFTDDALRELLGGTGTGLEPDELERRAGRPLGEAVTVALAAELPGDVDGGADGPARWSLPLGGSHEVAARSTVANGARVRWAAVSAAAAALLVAVVAVGAVRRRGDGSGGDAPG